MPTDNDRPAAPPGPDAAFWQAKFDARATPWDRGAVNPQIEEWVSSGVLEPIQRGSGEPVGGAEEGADEGAEQGAEEGAEQGARESSSRLTRVLVPGCGSGHEVAMLAERGFDVTGVDYAPAAVERTRERLQGLLQSKASAGVVRAQVVEADLLAYEPVVPFDVIYEQTCLCALYPDHWRRYADRLFGWLRPGGSLLALFMQASRDGSRSGYIEGPPYHCDINGMRALFCAERWHWPKPAYPAVRHPSGMAELAVVLTRR